MSNAFEHKVNETLLIETKENLEILAKILDGGDLTELKKITIRSIIPFSDKIPTEDVLAACGEELVLIRRLLRYGPYIETYNRFPTVLGGTDNTHIPPPHMLVLRVDNICGYCRGRSSESNPYPQYNPFMMPAQPQPYQPQQFQPNISGKSNPWGAPKEMSDEE